MKRIYLSTVAEKENDDKAPCRCSIEVLKQFSEMTETFSEMNSKFTKITCDIKELKDIVQIQNETIMAALSAQKVLTESLVRQEKNNVAIKNVFPIKSVEELKVLNDIITDENKQIYVNTMRLSLKGKLPKTLTTILSLQLIIHINIDGTHGKKRLKDYEKVFDALMESVRSLCDDPDKELRNALGVIKKRNFHNVCVEKKLTNFNSQ